MSTADEVRSILREAGVPLTRKQIIDMLPAGCSDQAAYVFPSDAKKRGELERVMEDGNAAYRFAAGAPARAEKTPAAKKSKSCAPKAAASSGHTRDLKPVLQNTVIIRSEAPAHAVAALVDGKHDRSSLADLVGYTEAALQAYIESCVNPSIYGFLLNARDAARREYERAHA